MKVYLSLLWIIVSVSAWGQQVDSLAIGTDKTSGLDCFQRPAFFNLNYRTLPAVSSLPENAGTDIPDFEGNKLIEASLAFPVIMKNDFKLLGQLRFKNEWLYLGDDDNHAGQYDFKNAGLLMGYQWHYRDNLFIVGHLSGALKSNVMGFDQFGSKLDYSGSVMWGRDDENGMMAIGVLLGNKLRRFNIYPLLMYQKQFSNSWFIDAKLPKVLKLSKAIRHDNLYIHGVVEGNGASYYIDDPDASDGYHELEYRRKAIDLYVGVDKEIHDWLWGSVQLGLTQPLYGVLVQPGDPARDRVHNFRQGFTPFINFSLFAVPPRALYRKLGL